MLEGGKLFSKESIHHSFNLHSLSLSLSLSRRFYFEVKYLSQSEKEEIFQIVKVSLLSYVSNAQDNGDKML